MSETFDERVARLRERTSVAGWKGPRSLPVDAATWILALDFEKSCRSMAKQEPFVSCGDFGSVHFEWKGSGGAAFSLEVDAKGTFTWEEEDGSTCGFYWGDNVPRKEAFKEARRFFYEHVPATGDDPDYVMSEATIENMFDDDPE
jgi:hypothetical protein